MMENVEMVMRSGGEVDFNSTASACLLSICWFPALMPTERGDEVQLWRHVTWRRQGHMEVEYSEMG